MLAHIAKTLQQRVEGKPVDGAVGPFGEKLVVFAGHDTNLAGVAALLGVHWTLDGRADDTPPGTQLAFELWQHSDGSFSVAVTAAMQTLHQMREMTPLTLADPAESERLALPACPKNESGCTWKEFNQAVTAVAAK
jgi:4-phytase/acid phosphatase